MKRQSTIKETVEGQLENMGFDAAQKNEQMAIWKEFIATPLLLAGHGAKRMVKYLSKLTLGSRQMR